MAEDFRTTNIRLKKLMLDAENPRFASSALVQSGGREIPQDQIIQYMLERQQVTDLAYRINQKQGLYPCDLIACFPRGDKYIVLEGNRRTCACKLLSNRKLIPSHFKESFPEADEKTLKNITTIKAVVYPDRASAQAYLSDRHITGPKKWSAIEKNNFYMNLFREYGDINQVQEMTKSNLRGIKLSIIRYQFFMDVFEIIKEKDHSLDIEKLDYLPMVERFMDIIVGNDPDVGLNLYFDEATMKYSCNDPAKEQIFKQILELIGTAFLLRKRKHGRGESESNKITGKEIENVEQRRNLILQDERIPGLLNLIRQYKGISQDQVQTSSHTKDHEQGTRGGDSKVMSENIANRESSENNADDVDLRNEDNSEYIANRNEPTEPQYYQNNKRQKYLRFAKKEVESFPIHSGGNCEDKILHIINELSMLSIDKYPCACAFLCRSLMEMCTRFFFRKHEGEPGASGRLEKYNDSNMEANVKVLIDAFLFNPKDSSQKREYNSNQRMIRASLMNDKSSFVKTLHGYIHYDTPVDREVILNKWGALKIYVAHCLNGN